MYLVACLAAAALLTQTTINKGMKLRSSSWMNHFTKIGEYASGRRYRLDRENVPLVTINGGLEPSFKTIKNPGIHHQTLRFGQLERTERYRQTSQTSAIKR